MHVAAHVGQLKGDEGETGTICPLCETAGGSSLVKNLARGSVFFDFNQCELRAGLGADAPVPLQNYPIWGVLETFCDLG